MDWGPEAWPNVQSSVAALSHTKIPEINLKWGNTVLARDFRGSGLCWLAVLNGEAENHRDKSSSHDGSQTAKRGEK